MISNTKQCNQCGACYWLTSGLKDTVCSMQKYTANNNEHYIMTFPRQLSKALANKFSLSLSDISRFFKTSGQLEHQLSTDWWPNEDHSFFTKSDNLLHRAVSDSVSPGYLPVVVGFVSFGDIIIYYMQTMAACHHFMLHVIKNVY